MKKEVLLWLFLLHAPVGIPRYPKIFSIGISKKVPVRPWGIFMFILSLRHIPKSAPLGSRKTPTKSRGISLRASGSRPASFWITCRLEQQLSSTFLQTEGIPFGNPKAFGRGPLFGIFRDTQCPCCRVQHLLGYPNLVVAPPFVSCKSFSSGLLCSEIKLWQVVQEAFFLVLRPLYFWAIFPWQFFC